MKFKILLLVILLFAGCNRKIHVIQSDYVLTDTIIEIQREYNVSKLALSDIKYVDSHNMGMKVILGSFKVGNLEMHVIYESDSLSIITDISGRSIPVNRDYRDIEIVSNREIRGKENDNFIRWLFSTKVVNIVFLLILILLIALIFIRVVKRWKLI